MSSRMNRYFDEANEVVSSRYQKNENLYKEINKSELNNYEIKSNATVLGENKNEIDVDKIKKILDNKYNEIPQRKSIRIEQVEEIKEEVETTKEYDINVIIEKAREQKEVNYEEERLKKLRDTQYDILKKLNFENTEPDKNGSDDLKELINTITLNENNNKKEETLLDMFSDLKGSDDTEVLEGLKEEVTEKNKVDDKEKIKDETNEENDDSSQDTKLINSFYTSSNAFDKKDFEDMEDFSKEIESNNLFIKLLVAIISIIFIVGIVLIIKTVYFS